MAAKPVLGIAIQDADVPPATPYAAILRCHGSTSIGSGIAWIGTTTNIGTARFELLHLPKVMRAWARAKAMPGLLHNSVMLWEQYWEPYIDVVLVVERVFRLVPVVLHEWGRQRSYTSAEKSRWRRGISQATLNLRMISLRHTKHLYYQRLET